MRHRTIFASRTAKVACLLLVTIVQGAHAPTEYELKAAYIYNVLRLVHRAGAKPGEHVTLCTYSAGPIEQGLRTLESSSLHGRKFRVRTLTDSKELAECDAVFFGRSNGAVPRLVAESGAHRVLTIGNDEHFLAAGGMIALFVESRRVVVEVNPAALAAAGWVASSYLLEVARVVKEPKQ
jgi:hypothetical protein